MKNSNKIAVIGAMECEVNSLKNLLQDIETKENTNFYIYTGKISGKEIILSKSGVGKVCAAMTVQYIIDKYNPDIIVNTGVAGGLSPTLKIGDVIIGSELVQYDFDASALGYAKGYICNNINPDKPTVFYSDKELIDVIVNNSSDLNINVGRIATGDMFVGSVDKKRKIFTEFNALAAEMEGCAIAQCAYANNIPFIIVRAVSDMADGTAMEAQNEFEKMVSKISSSAVEVLIKNI
ncbi:5'-methylthioadenosine/adenosylhomocysteine nucleosidase [bacterium]|nr:5'-methylthioadenosine/adenosylhomocysteine nucleosidase [bacterium]